MTRVPLRRIADVHALHPGNQGVGRFLCAPLRCLRAPIQCVTGPYKITLVIARVPDGQHRGAQLAGLP